MGNPEAGSQLGFDDFAEPKPKHFIDWNKPAAPDLGKFESKPNAGPKMRIVTDPSESGRTYEVPDHRN